MGGGRLGGTAIVGEMMRGSGLVAGRWSSAVLRWPPAPVGGPTPPRGRRPPRHPAPGRPALPNGPGGETFLAGKPAPGQNYDGSASARPDLRRRELGRVPPRQREPGHGQPAARRLPEAGPTPTRRSTAPTSLNGVTELVSMGSDGCYANGESSFPDVSGDGRYVVYMSKGTNLVPDGNGGQQDIFVKDMRDRRHDDRQHGAERGAGERRLEQPARPQRRRARSWPTARRHEPRRPATTTARRIASSPSGPT